MPQISFSENGQTPFEKLLGHNPEILRHWANLENVFFTKTNLSPELLEQVRRTLAFGNKCEYCMAKGKPNEIHKDKRESLAIGFAQLFVQDYISITDSQFDILREEFTENEIAELCSFICFITASQRFGALMKLKPLEGGKRC
ncbi:MAG: carboxymuconolactone decarboxylase family protein [Nitrospirae bacterium]|nr:carboxymuconolactone decarboxylase family protein [Nitrospirota bacterium]MDA8339083.1 hypothetical protein [Nitrospiraceae bacterium]